MSRVPRMAAVLAPVLLAALTPALAGDIVGSVKYAGHAPAPAKIAVTKDQAVCGKVDHLEESLLVGSDRGVKNAVINVTDPKDGKKMTAAATPAIDQNGCRFMPRVQIVPAGQSVDVINDDGILHNIHTWSKVNTPFNRAQPKFLKKMSFKFDKPETVKISCDVHSWMQGWVIVADNPYYALSDDKGSFKIAGVPAGSYTVKYWHEKLGEQTRQVTVPATGSVTADFEFPAK